jgi:hypothetical protein
MNSLVLKILLNTEHIVTPDSLEKGILSELRNLKSTNQKKILSIRFITSSAQNMASTQG